MSTIGSLWLYLNYDQVTGGFQFHESVPLVPSLGITYQLALDGMSLVLVLLTAIIILGGVFLTFFEGAALLRLLDTRKLA